MACENKDSPIVPPWHDDYNTEHATALSAQRLTRLRGLELVRDPFLNKGTAFTERERDLLGLRGLLPPRVFTIEQQLERQLASFNKQPNNIAKYLFLERLHNRNETVYYRFLLEHIESTMPIVYTPTVGQACIEFSDMYRSRVRGLYFSKSERRFFKDIVRNWPQHEVDIIVITDGSRILGLGDLGVNGMGIPIGKLALYVAAAGFMPWRTLPVTIDMGTNNKDLLESPNYVGEQVPRPDDETFYTVMHEVIDAIRWRWPKVLIQFEDFSNEHAFGLLDRYMNNIFCFNDDIQGTAAVALAGVLAGLRISSHDGTRGKLYDQKIVFLGAGSAGVGVADLIAEAMRSEMIQDGITKDVSLDEIRKSKFWLIDSKGMVTSTRGDNLQDHKIRYARDEPSLPSLLEVVKAVKPTVIMGLAGMPGGAFTEEVIKTMHAGCIEAKLRPLIFALSNPTSKSECTAEQAYAWTDGDAIFSSGSPFEPVEYKGKTYVTGQGNNMYIFPGVGYGAVMCEATQISATMFYVAAKSLADQVKKEELDSGSVYPDIKTIRHVTLKVAEGLCIQAVKEGLSRKSEPKDGWVSHLKSHMWWPHFQDYV